jgi:alkylation response protein AidB-like acyl-CoA dehydrogenase
MQERQQFGAIIGSFQALQHRVARLFVDLQLADGSVAMALAALDENDKQAPILASLAKQQTSDLAEKMLNEATQLHGGIGVTDELDIGLFLKRARVLSQLLGDGTFHRDRYAMMRGF